MRYVPRACIYAATGVAVVRRRRTRQHRVRAARGARALMSHTTPTCSSHSQCPRMLIRDNLTTRPRYERGAGARGRVRVEGRAYMSGQVAYACLPTVFGVHECICTIRHRPPAHKHPSGDTRTVPRCRGAVARGAARAFVFGMRCHTHTTPTPPAHDPRALPRPRHHATWPKNLPSAFLAHAAGTGAHFHARHCTQPRPR